MSATSSAIALATLPDVLTTEQVCSALGISTKTWQRWRRARVEPVAELVPPTRYPRYAKVAVERYLHGTRNHGTSYQKALAR